MELANSNSAKKKSAKSASASLFTFLGMAKTIFSSTVLPSVMWERVAVMLTLEEGVAPGAEAVVEGLGVLRVLGRLVMESLG